MTERTAEKARRPRNRKAVAVNALLALVLLAFCALTAVGCATAPHTPTWVQWAFVSTLVTLGVVASVGTLLSEAWDRF